MFTTPQLHAYLILADAITQARARGQVVGCVERPELWDDDHAPVGMCRWCPVMEQCRAYAATGAVRHGVVAGQEMNPAGHRRGVAA